MASDFTVIMFVRQHFGNQPTIFDGRQRRGSRPDMVTIACPPSFTVTSPLAGR
jgi:hypothetical protein